MYPTNTSIILNNPLKQNYSINNINETKLLNPRLLLDSFFTNKNARYNLRYDFDDNSNANQSADSHFLASSIGIFGLCRAFLVFVLLAPRNESSEHK